jgi:hypothetical protein
MAGVQNVPRTTLQDPLPPVGGWDPLDPDYWEARADNPYKASCRFLDWGTPAAAAQTYNIPRTDIQGLLWEVQPPPQDGAVVFKLRLCNLIEQEITALGASRMSAEIDRCGIFSVEYNDRASFVRAVKSNPQIDLVQQSTPSTARGSDRTALRVARLRIFNPQSPSHLSS